MAATTTQPLKPLLPGSLCHTMITPEKLGNEREVLDEALVMVCIDLAQSPEAQIVLKLKVESMSDDQVEEFFYNSYYHLCSKYLIGNREAMRAIVDELMEMEG